MVLFLIRSPSMPSSKHTIFLTMGAPSRKIPYFGQYSPNFQCQLSDKKTNHFKTFSKWYKSKRALILKLWIKIFLKACCKMDQIEKIILCNFFNIEVSGYKNGKEIYSIVARFKLDRNPSSYVLRGIFVNALISLSSISM